MIKLEPGVLTDDVIHELVDGYNQMEKILKDILPILAKDHPDIVFKHMNYFLQDESHLEEIPDKVEDLDIF